MLTKEQLDAIKARVEKMSSKVAEIDKLERIAFQDVPALIAQVERLETIALHFMEKETKLREALKFYADKENWEWHEINDLETAPGDILNDNGETARKALDGDDACS